MTAPAAPNRPWVAVRSSNIERFAYEDAKLELYVEFTSGATYVYSGVPLAIYTGLMAASSAGGYLNAMVKGKYDYRRL